MFDESRCTGAALRTVFCGIPMRTPFLLSSGPLSYGAAGMIRAHNAGCGAVVTKTIRLGRAINPVIHIASISGASLINCEKWSDADRLVWYEREIPAAKAAGVQVIASVGHTPTEARAIVEDAERAGACAIELVSYAEETLLPMLDEAKKRVRIPVICKLSANWSDPVATGLRCLAHGADGLCGVDSVGPGLSIDIERAAPRLHGAHGLGWVSGGAIRPLALAVDAGIASARPGFAGLYGSGGCMEARDAVEFFMAGCSAVGVCSVGILRGVEAIEAMCYELSALLGRLGYKDIAAVRGAALPALPAKDEVRKLAFSYRAEPDATGRGCTKCRRCVRACCYEARTLEENGMRVDEARCRSCGVCASVCPTGALTAHPLPQDAEDLARAAEAAEFERRIRAESGAGA